MKNNKFILPVLILVGIIFLIATAGWGNFGIKNQKKIQSEITILKQKNDSLRIEWETREKNIERLKHDTFFIEYIARTKFGMTKKGEKAYHFTK